MLFPARIFSPFSALAETSFPSMSIHSALSLKLPFPRLPLIFLYVFHVTKVLKKIESCKQNGKKLVFFGGIFHPVFCKQHPSAFCPEAPSSAPVRSVQENFPHGAGKFPAPCAVALRYIHHFMLFYIMPSAGAPSSASRQGHYPRNQLLNFKLLNFLILSKTQGTYIIIYIIYILYILLIIIHKLCIPYSLSMSQLHEKTKNTKKFKSLKV